jgi:hypothetical protein
VNARRLTGYGNRLYKISGGWVKVQTTVKVRTAFFETMRSFATLDAVRPQTDIMQTWQSFGLIEIAEQCIFSLK